LIFSFVVVVVGVLEREEKKKEKKKKDTRAQKLEKGGKREVCVGGSFFSCG